jgi:glycosyltransferase involved in cell wall biosynthesis
MPLRIGMIAYTHYESDPRVRREAEALAARGDEVVVWCLGKEGADASDSIKGVRLDRIFLPRYRGGRALAYAGSYARFFAIVTARITAAHAKKHFDVVHVHTMPDFMIFGALVPRLSGAKLILDMHDLMPELYALKFHLAKDGRAVKALKWVQKSATALADYVISVHQNQYELLLRDVVPARKLAIVMNAADPALFPPRTDEPASGPSDPIRVVYHGTVLHRYGVDIAVRAFAEARKAEPLLAMQLLGGGDYAEEVLALAKDLGLAPPAFEMTGKHRPLDEIARLIRSAHIGLVPNRDDQEDSVLPTKLLEYVAVGIPAVVASTRTVRRFFTADQVELVPVGDVGAMAEAILRLARDPARRSVLVTNGRAWQEEYGWEVNKRALFRTIDSLCSEKLRAERANGGSAASEPGPRPGSRAVAMHASAPRSRSITS